MLKESQPVVYRILENGFKNKKTSHAYLISGEKGMPVKQTALFLAQSFLCDSSESLACEDCINCIRVKDGTYADLIVIDGEKETVGEQSGFHSGADPMAFTEYYHKLQFIDLINAIDENRKPMVDENDGRKPVDIILAAYESSRTGKKIELI